VYFYFSWAVYHVKVVKGVTILKVLQQRDQFWQQIAYGFDNASFKTIFESQGTVEPQTFKISMVQKINFWHVGCMVKIRSL
jgi:hypothetical protein